MPGNFVRAEHACLIAQCRVLASSTASGDTFMFLHHHSRFSFEYRATEASVERDLDHYECDYVLIVPKHFEFFGFSCRLGLNLNFPQGADCARVEPA